MLAVRDNLSLCFAALRAHKLRASLTMLGLTMGVATLITVMTIVQGANLYVEQKIANLGTNVFQIARTPFAVTDFNIIIKALKFKKIETDDMRAVAEGCPANAEYGGYRHAHCGIWPLFHGGGSRAPRWRLLDRGHASTATVSWHGSHWEEHSRRERRVQGSRGDGKNWQRPWAGPGQFRNGPASRLPSHPGRTHEPHDQRQDEHG